MIESSAAYKEAIVGDSRKIVLKVILNIISPDITYWAVTGSAESRYSKGKQLYDKIFEAAKYATLEHNRWGLDGTWAIYPEDSKELVGQVGMQSQDLSDGQRDFFDAEWVEMSFSNVSILQACSVYFSDIMEDGVPKDFKVEIKQGETVYYEKNFVDNTAKMVSLDGFTVYNPDAIRVTVTKWSLPSRRLRTIEIIPGIYEEWDGRMAAAFSLKHQGDTSCLSLPYGTCTLKVDNQSRRFEPRKKDGVFQSIEERQSIDISLGVELSDGVAEYKRLGLFYQYSNGWRTGDNGLTIQWDLVDIIGLLADREFIPPEQLPTTLDGWVQALATQLGKNFMQMYSVDANYADKALTVRTASDIVSMKCGDLLRNICMATGTWPRADAETGFLTIEPLWNQGNKIMLDDLESYPIMRANNDIGSIIFTLNDSNKTKYVVGGSTDAAETKSVNNPFIHTREHALVAARNIMSTSGGNRIETIGRGDPASEIGDVDTIWLDESTATTARRIQQNLELSDGVLKGCSSTMLQASGSFIYQNRAVLTENTTWSAPEGVTQLRIICVGGGAGGQSGTDGTWIKAGTDGSNGLGAKVWSETVNINNGQTFDAVIGMGGNTGENGTETIFGAYTSANGHVYPYGYTDIQSGDSFGRTGVKAPAAGSGDGGAAGKGGVKGNRRRETVKGEDGSTISQWVTDNRPGRGTPGKAGAGGCVVIYWDKEV